MHEYTPKPDRRLAITIAITCTVIGLALFLPITENGMAMLWLRTAGVWFFAGAFVVTDKYLITSYTYKIEGTDTGVPDLIIAELRAKKSRTVCRISLSDVTSLERLQKNEKRAFKKGSRVFNYRADLLPAECLLLTGTDRDGEFFIKFAPDKKTIELISAFLPRKN